MTTIPVINGPEDFDKAIRHAERHPETRWYVGRVLVAHGGQSRIPKSWGLTAAMGGDWSGKSREKAESKGEAMEGGSFPIRDKEDLKRAVKAFGRAKNKAKTKAHILKRARALGAMDLIPDSWKKKGATASADPRLNEYRYWNASLLDPEGKQVVHPEAVKQAVVATGVLEVAEASEFGTRVALSDRDLRALVSAGFIDREADGYTLLVDAGPESDPLRQGLTAAFRKAKKILRAFDWDPSLHPRGKDGRFIEKNGSVDVYEGRGDRKPVMRGTAVGMRRDEKGNAVVTVQADNDTQYNGKTVRAGDTIDVTPDRIAEAPDAKSRLDTGTDRGPSAEAPFDTEREAPTYQSVMDYVNTMDPEDFEDDEELSDMVAELNEAAATGDFEQMELAGQDVKRRLVVSGYADDEDFEEFEPGRVAPEDLEDARTDTGTDVFGRKTDQYGMPVLTRDDVLEAVQPFRTPEEFEDYWAGLSEDARNSREVREAVADAYFNNFDDNIDLDEIAPSRPTGTPSRPGQRVDTFDNGYGVQRFNDIETGDSAFRVLDPEGNEVQRFDNLSDANAYARSRPSGRVAPEDLTPDEEREYPSAVDERVPETIETTLWNGAKQTTVNPDWIDQRLSRDPDGGPEPIDYAAVTEVLDRVVDGSDMDHNRVVADLLNGEGPGYDAVRETATPGQLAEIDAMVRAAKAAKLSGTNSGLNDQDVLKSLDRVAPDEVGGPRARQIDQYGQVIPRAGRPIDEDVATLEDSERLRAVDLAEREAINRNARLSLESMEAELADNPDDEDLRAEIEALRENIDAVDRGEQDMWDIAEVLAADGDPETASEVLADGVEARLKAILGDNPTLDDFKRETLMDDYTPEDIRDEFGKDLEDVTADDLRQWYEGRLAEGQEWDIEGPALGELRALDSVTNAGRGETEAPGAPEAPTPEADAEFRREMADTMEGLGLPEEAQAVTPRREMPIGQDEGTLRDRYNSRGIPTQERIDAARTLAEVTGDEDWNRRADALQRMSGQGVAAPGSRAFPMRSRTGRPLTGAKADEAIQELRGAATRGEIDGVSPDEVDGLSDNDLAARLPAEGVLLPNGSRIFPPGATAPITDQRRRQILDRLGVLEDRNTAGAKTERGRLRRELREAGLDPEGNPISAGEARTQAVDDARRAVDELDDSNPLKERLRAAIDREPPQTIGDLSAAISAIEERMGQIGADVPDVNAMDERTPRNPQWNALNKRRRELMDQRSRAGYVPPGTPPRAYRNAPRDTEGRAVLSAGQIADFSRGDHSMSAHILDGVDADGNPVKVLSPEREALHDELLGRIFNGVEPPRGRKPRQTFLGGGSGAGKSTATKGLEGYPTVRELADYESPAGEAALLDADAFKLALPEWGQPDLEHAAGFTHEESSLLTKAAQAEALARGLDVVLDGTGDSAPSKMGGKVRAVRDAGYETQGIYVTVPTDEAIVRAVARGVNSGRLVPPKMVHQIHGEVSSTTDAVKDDYDDFSLFDTDVPLGSPPIPIVSRGQIVDQAKYDAFLAKRDQDYLDNIESARRIAETRDFRSDRERTETLRILDEAIAKERAKRGLDTGGGGGGTPTRPATLRDRYNEGALPTMFVQETNLGPRISDTPTGSGPSDLFYTPARGPVPPGGQRQWISHRQDPAAFGTQSYIEEPLSPEESAYLDRMLQAPRGTRGKITPEDYDTPLG